MEDLYRAAWADDACGTAAWQVGLIILAVVAGVFCLIGALAWLPNRRISPAERRVMLGIFGIVSIVVLVALGYALGTSQVLRRVSLVRPLLTVRWCDGLTERVESRSLNQIASFRHRTRLAGAKSKRIDDELVITFQGGETLTVPLSTDPQTTNRKVLREVIPREVIEQWITSLGERGASVPDGL